LFTFCHVLFLAV